MQEAEKEREVERRRSQPSFSTTDPAEEFFLAFFCHPASRIPLRASFSRIPPNLVHANEAIHTQFTRGRRSNMASLTYRHIGRLLHRLHFCRSYSSHFSVSVFFNSQSSVILVPLCSFFRS